jgi:hypothetical protein
VTPPSDLSRRLWRARTRHHHIDAVLREAGAAWQLSFQYDDRPMVTGPFAAREAAEAEATRRLRDLQRAGWNVHW